MIFLVLAFMVRDLFHVSALIGSYQLPSPTSRYGYFVQRLLWCSCNLFGGGYPSWLTCRETVFMLVCLAFLTLLLCYQVTHSFSLTVGTMPPTSLRRQIGILTSYSSGAGGTSEVMWVYSSFCKMG